MFEKKDDSRRRAEELVAQMTLGEKCSQLKYESCAIPRLGIPAYNWWNEGLHGYARSGVATVFPQAIGMAASFDDELLERVGDVTATEARAKYNISKEYEEAVKYQGLTIWSPNINIFRDPRWGRGHETFGEDPYLTGRMGAAYVRGLQGKDGRYRKTDATLKHFAVHSGPERLRHGFDARVSKKDLYETYLAAFRYCIENAHPAAVMGAYNRTNGEACCASPTLQGILRGEFGFDGYFVSDCGAVNDINAGHHLTENAAESAALAVSTGCDLNCGQAYAQLLSAVEAGLVEEKFITEACVRLFTARYKLGMFDDDCKYNEIGPEVIACDKHRRLNRKMADECVVLLENNGILPLDNSRKLKIAVMGPNARSEAVLLGNYNGTPSDPKTLIAGIREACKGDVFYAPGCGYTKHPHTEQFRREAIALARRCDVVVMCMGLFPDMEGEEGAADYFGLNGDKPDLQLPQCQKDLLEAVSKVGKPVIFVNLSGSAVDLALAKEKCAAVLQVFYPGEEGGAAVADVLFGKTSPSGRLPVTFYCSEADLPPIEDYAMEGRTYRFFRGDPLYPFGYGLSYTNFQYSGLRVTEDGKGGLDVSLTVKNESRHNGSEPVLVYVRLPEKPGAPIRSLADFGRVYLLRGLSCTMHLHVPATALCYVNEDGGQEPAHGDITVEVGQLKNTIRR